MKTILIVDDEKKVRKIYGEFFIKEGFAVKEASDAMEAEIQLQKGPIDLMVLDINMPIIDGGFFYDAIKWFFQKTKVIIASVYPIDEQKRIINNAADYYDKSQGLKELLEKVKNAL